MRLIYGLHSSYQYQIGSYQYGADGFKNLGSKTIGSSIQSFFEISGCTLLKRVLEFNFDIKDMTDAEKVFIANCKSLVIY